MTKTRLTARTPDTSLKRSDIRFADSHKRQHTGGYSVVGSAQEPLLSYYQRNPLVRSAIMKKG